MKFKELSRTTSSNEVRSSYEYGNMTINLTSRFKNEFPLEDAMYEIILQRLRSQNKSERGHKGAGLSIQDVV